MEWGSWNPSTDCNGLCNAGVCISTGCTENWQCSSWGSCSNDNQTRTCTDLNNCGTTIQKPAIFKSCGCEERWQCNWDICKNGYSNPVCTDLNNCGSENNKPQPIKCSNGTLCYLNCSEWSNCNVDYSLEELVMGKYDFNGIKERLCGDGCSVSFNEKQECNMFAAIRAKKVNWCYEDYVEIYDASTDELVSRVKQSTIGNNSKLNIGFMASTKKGYCSYCYDKLQNYDEQGIDCGGSCKECLEIPLDNFDYILWLTIGLWLILIILLLLLSRYYLIKK